MNRSSTSPSSTENILAASGMLILSMCGLVLYCIVLHILHVHRTQFANSFYRYLTVLGICDCIMLLLFILYAVPLTLLQSDPFGSVAETVAGFLCALSFYGSLASTASIALNRYWAVCKNETVHAVFSGRNVTANIVLIFCFGLFCGGAPTLGCCPILYYYTFYTWSYDLERMDGFLGYFMLLEQCWTFGVCICLFCCYVAILVEMRRSVKTVAASVSEIELAERKKAESRLALQFMFVGIYMFLFDIVFNVLPNMTQRHWYLYITSLMYIGNCSINPAVYLATNSQIREKASLLFKGSHHNQNQQVWAQKCARPDRVNDQVGMEGGQRNDVNIIDI